MCAVTIRYYYPAFYIEVMRIFMCDMLIQDKPESHQMCVTLGKQSDYRIFLNVLRIYQIFFEKPKKYLEYIKSVDMKSRGVV